MPCGCQSACGCTVIGDGETASVAREGDTFIVSAIPFVRAVEDTPCIDLDVDEEGVLTAEPILSDDPTSVAISCTVDGLTSSVVIDPASTAIVSEGPDGLRVDVPPAPPTEDSTPPGTMIFYQGLGQITGYIESSGDTSRIAYPALWDALTLVTTGATRLAGSDQITNVSTRFMAVGMPIEATDFSTGTVIVSIDSATSVTVSNVSGGSGNDTEVRIYPHGIGDGTTTFGLPRGDDRFALGFDHDAGGRAIGAIGGAETVTLDASELPTAGYTASVNDPGHDHTASSTDSGHAHGIDSDGTHNHTGGTARDSSFVTVEDPVTSGDFVYARGGSGPPGDVPNDIQIPTFLVDVDPGPGTSIRPAQGTRQFTSNDGAHDHGGATDPGSAAITTDVDPNGTGITVDIENVGGDQPHENMPPYLVGRWMIKV